MATNKITIVVDYGKAVAKVNDLKIGFDELGTKVVATRNRIRKAVGDAADAVNGSVKALMREKEAWQQIQASLSTTNEQYRKYQAQIDAVNKKLSEITDTRKEHEIVQRGSIAYYDQEIAKLREYQRNTARSAKQVEEFEQRIQSLRLRQSQLTGQTKGLDKAAQSFSSSAGAAGATVTEFGRTIGDLPFGLIGITNNIQQLSQQFTDLQAKSGGMKGALEAIKTTLMGPAGFVVAINIVTSALLYFTRQKEKANKETKDFNDAMLTEGKTLQSLITLYYQLNEVSKERAQIIGALAQSDKDLADALEKAGDNEKERAKIAEEYMKLKLASNQADEKRAKIAEKNEEILKSQIITEEEVLKIQSQIDAIAGVERMAAERAALQKKIDDNNKLKGVLSELAEATLEYSDAQKALNEAFKQSELEKFRESFAEFREEVKWESFAEGTERLSAQLSALEDSVTNVARTYGTNSVEFEQLILDIEKKRHELKKAQDQDKKEAADKEKERLEALNEMNQEYLDNLTAQYDESGIARLKQQERDAIKEAEALGASQKDLLRIREYYANEIQKVEFAAAEKASQERIKENEKKEKEDEKKAKDALAKNKKRLEDFFDAEIDAMKSKVDLMTEVFSNFGTVLDELDQISQSRFERQINSLKEQRDIIRTNDALTKEEKEQQLTDIQRKENDIQRKRIKAERDMFTLKQTIVLAEMILKQKAFVQEQIMMAQMTAALAKQSATNLALTAAEETGEATMSIGTFMKELGPWGIAAFALSIGGVIASIVSARRKAQAEIAGLSDAPISLGGGGGGAAAPAAPSFNVVGASAQNQLAEAIAGTESQPVKAYVVSSDVTTAQELDRKIIEGASI